MLVERVGRRLEELEVAGTAIDKAFLTTFACFQASKHESDRGRLQGKPGARAQNLLCRR